MIQQLDKLFVPLEIAIELYMLGFNEPCIAHRIKKEGVMIDLAPGSLYLKAHPSVQNSDDDYSINAPTFQQVSEWFLTKNMHVTYTPIFVNEAFGVTKINCYVPHCNGDNYDVEYETSKEAYVAAINTAIEICKEKSK